METEEEWGAVSLDPRQPLLAQKVPTPPTHRRQPSSDCFLFVSAGDRRSVGVPTVAQRAELVFLPAADEPSPFSILLPLLSVLLTRAGLSVPLQRPLGVTRGRVSKATKVREVTLDL